MDTDEFARTVDQNWHALGSPWSLRHFPNGGGSATAKGLRQHPEPDQWPAWTARHGSACMSGILTSTQASGSAVTGHLCPKTDVVASKWIAIATITAVFGHTSPNEPSWRHKMLESADLARLPSDRSRKWEISVNGSWP